MSSKERVVFLDRAAFTQGDLPIPDFDHNWSEYPDSDAADIVPRLFWSTIAITHKCPLDADTIGQLHKLKCVVVTGPAAVDTAACKTRGIAVRHVPASAIPGQTLIDQLEALVNEAGN
jgi:glycerate dehydrogenase